MIVQSILPILTEGDTYRVTSPFGERLDPMTGRAGARHDGIDLVLWKGYGALSSIGAAFDGIVKAVSYDGSRGNYVMIDHGEGVETHYYHLAHGTVTVALGDHVSAGQVIGQMGSTGASTGAHLHFQLELYGEPVDPIPFIDGKEVFGMSRDDIPAEWAKEAVEWAQENGILYGDEHGNLRLHEACTREMMVVFLHRLRKLVTEGEA